MKKILIVMSVAIIMALCSAPSFVNAATVVGKGFIRGLLDTSPRIYDIYCNIEPTYLGAAGAAYTLYGNSNTNYPLYYYYSGNTSDTIPYARVYALYIPSLENNFSLNGTTKVFNNVFDFNDAVPEDVRLPEPSLEEQRWDAFYEWYKNKYGHYPLPGSLIDMLRNLALGDDDPEATEIDFFQLPSPTPIPTPIPVQTIFVPDGNGNTTIIYQYPDPTTGVITQSPYNPNIDVDINCNSCNGNGNGDDVFGRDPTDPYTLSSSMIWGDGFGVEMSENPLTAANNSQKSLSEAAAEYSDSVNVLANSFNVLPFKWLTLIGLAGGILIIAGLIRTFLGG